MVETEDGIGLPHKKTDRSAITDPEVLQAHLIEEFSSGMSEEDVLYVQKAIAFAFVSHADTQPRKNGTPSVLHPLRVMGEMFDRREEWAESPEKLRIGLALAALHDTVEDVTSTKEGLQDAQLAQRQQQRRQIIATEFGEDVVEGVDTLTKVTYTPEGKVRRSDYFQKLQKAPQVVRAVKGWDRLDNLTSSLELPLSTLQDAHEASSYARESRLDILPLLVDMPALWQDVSDASTMLSFKARGVLGRRVSGIVVH